jgi:hypothetical protein
MQVNPIIMITRVRNLKESLNSINALPYPKVWVEYHTEKEIAEKFPSIIKEAKRRKYTHLAIFSDDGVISPESTEIIFDAAKFIPVSCGWCNMDAGPLSNISKSPLRDVNPTTNSYDLFTITEILSHPDYSIRTWFSGASMHTMRLDLWVRHPYMCYRPVDSTIKDYKGHSSDYHLCIRLQNANVPIFAMKDSRIKHIRKDIRNSRENKLLFAKNPKSGVDYSIRWEE